VAGKGMMAEAAWRSGDRAEGAACRVPGFDCWPGVGSGLAGCRGWPWRRVMASRSTLPGVSLCRVGLPWGVAVR